MRDCGLFYWFIYAFLNPLSLFSQMFVISAATQICSSVITLSYN